MKLSTFDMLRVWAAITGLLLALAYFVRITFGAPHSEMLAMLVVAIGGFELALYAQDLIKTRRAQRG